MKETELPGLLEMARAGRIFRIFVSSTFADMGVERNILQNEVFPALRKYCENNNCQFLSIDLRWGVNEEASLDQKTMDICLTELSRCKNNSPRPNFIVLLGDRYGWVPLPARIDAHEFELLLPHLNPNLEKELIWSPSQSQEDLGWYRLDNNAEPPEYILRPRRDSFEEEKNHEKWLSTEAHLRGALFQAMARAGWEERDPRRMKYKLSATHQEILAGVNFPDDGMDHVFVFSRAITNLNELPDDNLYVDENSELLSDLKTSLRQMPGVRNFDYSIRYEDGLCSAYLDEFRSDAEMTLLGVIKEEINKSTLIDPRSEEISTHGEFGDAVAKNFVGRSAALEGISEYLSSPSAHPLVVHGVSGCGKTSLLARAAFEKSINDPNAILVRRFIGQTPNSVDLIFLVSGLAEEISSRAGNRTQVWRDNLGPDEMLFESLGAASIEKPVVVFLDALDQLNMVGNSESLNWIPNRLPDNAHLVISMVESESPSGDFFRSAQVKFPAKAHLRLDPMSRDSGENLLDFLLGQSQGGRARTLTSAQRNLIMDGFGVSPYPLYLKVACTLARNWHSFDRTPVEGGEVSLPVSAVGIIESYLDQLGSKEQHGTILITAFLGLLLTSRYGLSEPEILDLLSANGEVMEDLRSRNARAPRVRSLPPAIWLRMYGDLSDYLVEKAIFDRVLISFGHQIFYEAISNFLINRGFSFVRQNAKLADYFFKTARGGDANRDWLTNNTHSFSECVVHGLRAHQVDEVTEVLKEFSFLFQKIKLGLLEGLLKDFREAKSHFDPGPDTELAEFLRFFHENGNLLRRGNPDWPAYKVFLQLAAEESDGSAVSKKADQWLAAGHCDWFWLRSCVPNTTDNDAFPILMFEGHEGVVADVREANTGTFLTCGLKDNQVRLWDIETAECLSVFRDHESGVLGAVQIDFDLFLSWTTGGTLRIWSKRTGQCVYMQAELQLPISEICIEAGGSLVVRSGDGGAKEMGFKLSTQCSGNVWTVDDPLQRIGTEQVFQEEISANWSGGDQTISVKDTKSDMLVAQYRRVDDTLHSARFLKDGRLVFWTDDGLVGVWDWKKYGPSLFGVGEHNAKLRHFEVEFAQQQVDHRDQIPG